MALPVRIKTQLKTHAHVSNQKHTASQRGSIGHANALMRFVSVKQVDELGPAESRSVDKVLNLPYFALVGRRVRVSTSRCPV